ncbi:MAG: hypothetical protein J6J60_06490 [Clostridia bacterium]|nr:hypothetical protein [Clostridia bacterium]
MNKKDIKVNIILFLVLVILIIVYLIIPETRSVKKVLSKEEYRNKIYDELITEYNKKNDAQKKIIEDDELYKIQNEI